MDMKEDIRKNLLELIRSAKVGQGGDGNVALTDNDMISKAAGLDSLAMGILMEDVEKKYSIDTYRYFREGGSEKFGALIDYCADQISRKTDGK